MDMKFVLLEVTDGVGWLTINRPQSLNALNLAVLAELDAALAELAQSPAVKVVVLTGAGDKAFVAGGDVNEMAPMSPKAALAFARQGLQVLRAIEQMPKPVLAAVNGYALGGGLELALACDFIYASEKAKLGLPETTLGVIPGFGGTQTLARLIGPSRAKEVIFSGKMLSAQQAKDWGIVNEVCAPEDLARKVMETAQLIAHNGLVAVAHAKEAIRVGLNMAKEDGFCHESTLFSLLFATADQKEGMQAFVEKRKANFKGQ